MTPISNPESTNADCSSPHVEIARCDDEGKSKMTVKKTESTIEGDIALGEYEDKGKGDENTSNREVYSLANLLESEVILSDATTSKGNEKTLSLPSHAPETPKKNTKKKNTRRFIENCVFKGFGSEN